MTEWSGFWTTSGIGDGVDTGYTQTQVASLWHAILAHGSANVGVIPDFEDALVVTYETGAYHVAVGAGVVYGFLYMAPAEIELAAEAPVSATRVDRIVLQADWATQTVRAALISAGEGGGTVGLTQEDGTLWEIPLASASWAVGEDPVLTDEREFVGDDSSGTPETSDATPLTLALRDASGRTKMVAPSASADVAIKQTVDDHAALTGSNAHGAVSAATASQIITRDENGRAKIAAPVEDDDIARYDTVKDMLGLNTAHSSGSIAVGLTWGTIITLSSIVTVGETDFMVHGQFLADQAGGTGATIYCKMVLDGSSSGETYLAQSINGLHVAFAFHQVFGSVAAGTHSITLQVYSNYSDLTITERRLTCTPYPTVS